MEKRLLLFCRRKQSFMVYRGEWQIPLWGTESAKGWYGKYQCLVQRIPTLGTSDTNIGYNEYQPLVLSVSNGDIHCTQRRYRFMSIIEKDIIQ